MSNSPPALPDEPLPPPDMVTVEDASPSPPRRKEPPLPDEPLPGSSGPENMKAKEQLKGKGKQTDNGKAAAGAAEASDEGEGSSPGEHEEQAHEDAQSNEQQDEEEEWDPSAESSIKQTRKAVEERLTAAKRESSDKVTPARTSEADPTNGWQAVWAPAQNAYYFWNAKTGQTTWHNPLAPIATQTTGTTATSSQNSLASAIPANPPLPPASEIAPLPGTSSWGQQYSLSGSYPSNGYSAQLPLPTNGNAIASSSTLPPLDPDLALLLPGARASSSASTSQSQIQDAPYVTAAFNSRTGRFTPSTYAYTVDHLAEANRAKRQEGVFFDVAEWEKGREEDWKERKRKEMEDGGGEGGQRKVLKKDIDRFKEKAKEKKARNNAWLRN